MTHTQREKHIFPFLIKNWTFISTTVKWLWTYRISKLNLENLFQNPWLYKSWRFKNSFTYFELFLEFNSFICSNMNNYFNSSREIELKIRFQCIFFVANFQSSHQTVKATMWNRYTSMISKPLQINVLIEIW